MITTIPFSGFYNTLHDSLLDDELRGLFTDDQGDINWKLYNEAFDLIQWQKVFVLYAQDYTERFANEFKIRLSFESLNSPKEYNFATDRIFCNIDLEEVVRIYAATDKASLSDLIREKFSSRDGFSSFYSNNIEDWDKIETWNHNQVGTLIECYSNQETNNSEGFTSLVEYYMMVEASGNGYIENWLFESATDKAELNRLVSIHQYLYKRATR